MSASREQMSVQKRNSGHGQSTSDSSTSGISFVPQFMPSFTPELLGAMQTLPNIQISLGEITESLKAIKGLTQDISNIRKDLWEEDGFDFRISHVAQQQEENIDNIQMIQEENKKLREDVNMSKSVVINLDRTVRKQQSEITDLKSRSMNQNILIHNLPEESEEENLFEKIPHLIKQHFGVDTSFANIHRNGPKIPGKSRIITGRLSKFTDKEKILQAQRKQNKIDREESDQPDQNAKSEAPEKTFYVTPQRLLEVAENRKKLQEINNQYWKEKVKTRFVGEKLVFPNGNVYRDKVLKPKPENILDMTKADKKKLQQIPMSTIDCADEGNTFKAAAATTDTYNQVRNFFKKNVIDPSYATAEHNILVYRFKDGNGAIHEGHNDDGEYGAGRRLIQVLRSMNVTNMTCVISRFYGKHLGFRRFQIMENLMADMVLAHSG
ncbi:uncharacterized protein LOC134236103 [Saccostrea cucullata]|uniref:uncharacterized protein LOC134236103 n=1 Tax=Saccostrea cuccullata TaxID=36930 RepID=UPI002ED2DAEE